MLGRNSTCSCLPARGKDWRLCFLLLSAAGQIYQEVKSKGISQPQRGAAGRARGCTKWRVWASVCFKGNGLGTGIAGAEHLRLYKARESPLLWWRWNLLAKVVPSPYLLQDQERSAKQLGQAQEHCRVHFRKRKTARGTPKGLILNFSQGEKTHCFLGSYFTEARKGERSEISAARGNQGPSQPQLAHRSVVNAKQ